MKKTRKLTAARALQAAIDNHPGKVLLIQDHPGEPAVMTSRGISWIEFLGLVDALRLRVQRGYIMDIEQRRKDAGL